MNLESLLDAAREGRGPLKHARHIRRAVMSLYLPLPRFLVGFLSTMLILLRAVYRFLVKFLVREPYFRYHCEQVGSRLNLQGAVPQIVGNGRILVGDDVVVGEPCTWDLGYSVAGRPELIIGNRVSINYRNIISVAKSVQIGDYTMIAGNVCIFDNTSHPVSPERRRSHKPISAQDVAPVVIGRNCWIGLNSIILRGVTIGDNSIVAAGSVVTKSVPPNTIVAGNPAVAVRTIVDDTADPAHSSA